VEVQFEDGRYFARTEKVTARDVALKKVWVLRGNALYEFRFNHGPSLGRLKL
jgi:hypothetical protein